MTNPASAMRMLITYAITIPLAIMVGYLLTNPLDYGTMGFIGLILAFIVSPIFIRWHYQILIFGLGCPMICFFLVGRPPLYQVVILVSLMISLVERATSDRRFLSVPLAAWPLLYIAAMAYFTSRLTGGIGLHQLGGGGGGGGKKYLVIFIGIAGFFALTSRAIPKEKRTFYIGLYILSGLAGTLGDLGAVLGGPFHALNLLFPSSSLLTADFSEGKTRLASLGNIFGGLLAYMLARYGMRGIFLSNRAWRAPAFIFMFPFIMLGGFRNFLIGALVIYTILFFLDGLHRSKLLPMVLLAGALIVPVLAVSSTHLPFSIQRSLSFLPFKWDEAVVLDADASTGWRQGIWAAMLPQVTPHLLLGKGYALAEEDFEYMGGGAFAGLGAGVDASQQTLAISGDYHSGPLSTLIPFGIWGAIGMLWLMAVSLFVAYRNFRYGDPEIRPFNAFLFANIIWSTIGFFFIFGAFDGAVADYAKSLGISLALNWGICQPAPRPAVNLRIKPLPLTAPTGNLMAET